MAGPLFTLPPCKQRLLTTEQLSYRTTLPVHLISFFLMTGFSLISGVLLFMEQYFFRRVTCFHPANFDQPAGAVAEYCWEHGKFLTNTSSLDFLEYVSPPSPLRHTWIQQSYAYFFIRFLVFTIPTLIWKLKYKAYVQAFIKASVDIIKELEAVWLKHGQLAESAFHGLTPGSTDNPVSQDRQQLRASLRAIVAMTRDAVQITLHQVPHYAPVLSFIHLRMFLEVIMLSAFVLVDFVLFLLCMKYTSTDFHCHLPNGETILCMTPMMQLLWQVSLLSLLVSCVTLLMTSCYSMFLLCSLLSNNTKQCFLQRIPYATRCHDLKCKSRSQTRIYKLLSKFLLLNYAIVQPLLFLEAFVAHLDDNQQVPMDLLMEDDTGVKIPAHDNYDGVKNRHQQQVWDSLLSTDI